MCDMSDQDAKNLIMDFNDVMRNKYNFDDESVNKFWGTLRIGHLAMERV